MASVTADANGLPLAQPAPRTHGRGERRAGCAESELRLQGANLMLDHLIDPPIESPREIAFAEELERLDEALNNARQKKIITAYTIHESGDDPDWIEGAVFFAVHAADSACELEMLMKHLAASVEVWRKQCDRPTGGVK